MKIVCYDWTEVGTELHTIQWKHLEIALVLCQFCCFYFEKTSGWTTVLLCCCANGGGGFCKGRGGPKQQNTW